jgi:hypothetical protein
MTAGWRPKINKMKKNQEKQHAGVWLDSARAMIITNTAVDANGAYAIEDKVNGTANQSAGNEHTMNNAKQSNDLKYFKSVSQLLLRFDELFIFGPGKSQEQFKHHLESDLQFRDKKITIGSAEHLTDPQMIAKVRDFYGAAHS